MQAFLNVTNYSIDFFPMYSVKRNIGFGGVSYDEAYVKIFNTSKSVDEFKERYLDLQAKYEAKFGKIAEQSKKDTQKEIQETQKQQENEKTFKPIQGESQNKETYQNKDTNELLKKLLENNFNLSKELEILFGVKIDDKDINNNDFAKIFSKLNLHNIKSVDLKA